MSQSVSDAGIGMQPIDMNQPEQARPALLGADGLHAAERELLDRVREVARRITERVAKTLSDTETRQTPAAGEAPQIPQ